MMISSTLDNALLLRARRMATRRRAGVACASCKAKKARCSDYRPCSRCKQSGQNYCLDSEQLGLDQPFPTPNNADSFILSLSSWTNSTIPSPEGFSGTTSSQMAQTARGPSMFLGPAILAVASEMEPKPLSYFAQRPASLSAIQLLASHAACGSDADCKLEPEHGAWAWAWEVEAGPGGVDPFHDDWKRCQLLWAHAEGDMSVAT